MSPLSNANYNKIVTVIGKIVGEKIHYNKRSVNKQKNEKNVNKQFRWNGHFECSELVSFSLSKASHK